MHEVKPGHVVVIKRRGTITENAFTAALPRASCSFERIYFSRGNDLDIYRERQALGGRLADQVIKSIGHDWANTGAAKSEARRMSARRASFLIGS